MAKMKKSDREAYGKLKKLTPAMEHQIDWLMGRVHVGTSDEQVEADMHKRLKPIAGVNDALIEQAVKYALQAHHKNQGLYTDVMSGRLGGGGGRRNPRINKGDPTKLGISGTTSKDDFQKGAEPATKASPLPDVDFIYAFNDGERVFTAYKLGVLGISAKAKNAMRLLGRHLTELGPTLSALYEVGSEYGDIDARSYEVRRYVHELNRTTDFKLTSKDVSWYELALILNKIARDTPYEHAKTVRDEEIKQHKMKLDDEKNRYNPSAPRRRMRPYGNIHASKRMMYPYGNPAPTATMKAIAGHRRGHDVGQIYVADLASYNAGELCGEWIVPDSDPSVLGEQIQEVISKCGGEEWAIHDYDEFPDLGEHPSIEEIAGVAGALEEHGDVMRALLHDDPKYWGRDIDAAKRHIEDNLAGVFKDARREFVPGLIDDGVVGTDQMKQYFDYEAFGRDIRMDLDEEGEDSWAADMSDTELGEHYADDMGHDLRKQTIETYFDADGMYEALENGGEINVVEYGGKDYVFWNR